MTELKISSKSFTQKNKNKLNVSNNLWNLFDTECKSQSIECIYRTESEGKGEREFCECCQGNLVISDEGFLSCQNQKCGIIYKDSLDSTAEWRYYGNDDNQSSDPTRCGYAN